MYFRLFSFLVFTFLILPIDCRSDEHPHPHHGSHSDGLEIGISLEYTYIDEGSEEHDDEEEGESHDESESHDGSESVAGIHAHVLKSLSGEGLQKYLGVGFGGEILFTDDPHYGLMGSLAVYPLRDLALMVSPGVEIAKHDGSYETEFAMHYEISYGFEVGDFHVGPVIGFSHTQDSEHYAAGIHFGF
jgi:hypothetical protein